MLQVWRAQRLLRRSCWILQMGERLTNLAPHKRLCAVLTTTALVKVQMRSLVIEIVPANDLFLVSMFVARARCQLGIPVDITRLHHALDVQIIALCLGANIQHGNAIRAHKYLLPFDVHTWPALQLMRDLVTGVLYSCQRHLVPLFDSRGCLPPPRLAGVATPRRPRSLAC